MKVSIITATFGAESWRELALNRAYPSALNQGAHEVIVGHDPEGTIASVRNSLAEKAEGDWLCFLDGDDELAPGYLEAMKVPYLYQLAIPPALRQIAAFPELLPDEDIRFLLTPAVSYVTARGKRATPKIWPECSLSTGSWLVVSTLIPRDLFFQVGGFRDYGDPPGSIGYEDWGLFSLLAQAGATVVKVPEAVLYAHISPASRNRSPDRKERLRWHYEVGRDVWPDVYNDQWKVANGL